MNIPGTVGGAVKMNANAYGGDLAQVLDWVEIATPEGTDRRGPDQLGFSYRRSNLGPREVVVRASFGLAPDDPQRVKATLAEMRARRKAAQPSGIKTFGSTFKNPDDPRAEGRSAGVLLDEAGCRGLQVGGARFSEKHANFVENMGEATTADVIALMAEGRRRVQRALRRRARAGGPVPGRRRRLRPVGRGMSTLGAVAGRVALPGRAALRMVRSVAAAGRHRVCGVAPDRRRRPVGADGLLLLLAARLLAGPRRAGHRHGARHPRRPAPARRPRGQRAVDDDIARGPGEAAGVGRPATRWCATSGRVGLPARAADRRHPAPPGRDRGLGRAPHPRRRRRHAAPRRARGGAPAHVDVQGRFGTERLRNRDALREARVLGGAARGAAGAASRA